jgi:hypothetical protein
MRTIISGLSVLAAALMLNATAFAASGSLDPCDQADRNLKSLEVPVAALTVDVVDHVPTDPAAIAEQSAITDPAAPILYLTPRVTNILRDVFGTMTDKLPLESANERPQQPSSSPLADSDKKSDAIEPAESEDETSALPRFQQQMHRTDI